MRQRMLWPELWTDDRVMAMGPQAALLFVGLISAADDEGYVSGSPRVLRARLFGGSDDITVDQVADWLTAICRCNPNVQWYIGPDGQQYVWLRRYLRWQTIKHPKPSIVPPAPASYDPAGCLPYPFPGDEAYEPAEVPPPDLPAGARRVGRPKGTGRRSDISEPAETAARVAPVQSQGEEPPEPPSKVAASPTLSPFETRVAAAWRRMSSRDLRPAELRMVENYAARHGWTAEELATNTELAAETKMNGPRRDDPVVSVNYLIACFDKVRAMKPARAAPQASPSPPPVEVRVPHESEEQKERRRARQRDGAVEAGRRIREILHRVGSEDPPTRAMAA